MDYQRVYSLLLICILVTFGSVACVPSNEPAPTPTIEPSEPPPTATHTPGPTPWLNDQGYPLSQDDRGHLMVRIPAGTFQMGLTIEQAEDYCNLYVDIALLQGENPDCDEARLFFADQYPAFMVEIATDYWMDVYETSNAQYKACVDAGICSEPETTLDTLKAFWEDNDASYDDYAVAKLNFQQAQTFCEQWRGGRLPTQAEWEYAARGTDGRFWPWGTLDSLEQVEELAASRETSGSSLMPVDSYPKGLSPFGLYNMSGNIAEWVSDWFDPEHKSSEPLPLLTDSVITSGTLRVLKGGDFGDTPFSMTTVYFEATRPDRYGGGIRCVKDLEE